MAVEKYFDFISKKKNASVNDKGFLEAYIDLQSQSSRFLTSIK